MTEPSDRGDGRDRGDGSDHCDRPRVWEVGFEEHELAQLKRLARMPFHQKLKWLEEAHRALLCLRGGAAESDDSEGMR